MSRRFKLYIVKLITFILSKLCHKKNVYNLSMHSKKYPIAKALDFGLSYHVILEKFFRQNIFFCHFIVTTGQKFNPSESKYECEICIYLRILLIAVSMKILKLVQNRSVFK